MSRHRKFLRFLTPENREKLSLIGAFCLGSGFFVGNYLPHTMFLEKYRGIVQCYSSGIERPVPEKILEKISIALDKLDLHPYERNIIKPFTVYGFDIFTAGSTKQKFGAILGIPVNYAYDSINDINKQEIRFRNESIKWNTENGKLLQEAIVLTDDEKIFGICRGILQLRTNYVLLNAIYPSAAFLFVYSVGNVLNHRLKLLARPFSLRFVMYSILGLFGLGIWSFAKDFTQVRYDTEIDKKLCELGPEFINAGIQFYDKLLKKNIAIRNLTNSDVYTVKGNENYFLRQKSLPLTLRKTYFEMKLEEIRQQLEAQVTN